MKKRLQKLGPAAAIGIGAGIAAAVLCSLASRATLLAAILANLSPLPIMIAMLGYGVVAGAMAVVSATLTVSALFYAQEKFGNLDDGRARRPDLRFLSWIASFLAESPLGVEPGQGKSRIGLSRHGSAVSLPANIVRLSAFFPMPPPCAPL